MKRTLGLVLILAVSVFFTACGQQTAKPKPTKTKTPTTSSKAKPPTGSAGGTANTATTSAPALYSTKCAKCHGAQGQGGIGSVLNTSAVLQKYPTQTSLASFIQKSMPFDNPGSLTNAQATSLAAYVTQLAKGKTP